MPDSAANIPSPVESEKSASISADIERFAKLGLLDVLLADRSTEGNIIWACSSYADRGHDYEPEDEIQPGAITGKNIHVVRTRARKAQVERAALTKAHAEVFTPAWICKKMIDHADEAWYESREQTDTLWQEYVESRRLEITCGEAPYLVNRYDAADGTEVPVSERIGILSRKLALVSEHAQSRDEWIRWALAAAKSTYGYEFQGDNLLIARINVLCTLEDFAGAAGMAPFTVDEYREFARVISWNLWQMDGLTDCVPFGKEDNPEQMLRLPGFDDFFAEEEQLSFDIKDGRGMARIYDWKTDAEVEFRSLKRKGADMKFDYVIGNPPYQEEVEGNGRSNPLYNLFIDEAYKVSDKVELISPARFLFDAGQTPKSWNRKMLSDVHLKVMSYWENSGDVFPAIQLPGGICITYHDETRVFGAIGEFTQYKELNSILNKVRAKSSNNLSSIIVGAVPYRFSDLVRSERPDALEYIPASFDLRTNALSRLDGKLFYETKPDDGYDYVSFIGLINSKRARRFIRRDYVIDSAKIIDKYNLLVSKSNGGAGQLGNPIPARIIAKAIIAEPSTGHTQTFISVGAFDSEYEAHAASKYLQTRFLRVLLGIKKVTQDNPKDTWQCIPLEDFSPTSDIDWSRSIPDIETQLYSKYDLSSEEVDFIRKYIKEMS